MFSIELTKVAAKEFSRLPKGTQKQIGAVLDGCINDPWQFDYKKLKTPFPGFRIRSGRYRILFVVDDHAITVYSISHRKDAYKR